MELTMRKDTTIPVSRELRDELTDMKIIPEETYEGVIKRIKRDKEEAEKKVNELEERIAELEDENKRLEKLEDGMRKEIAKLKGR
jgi:predicted nuclease with TOPRIM domain